MTSFPFDGALRRSITDHLGRVINELHAPEAGVITFIRAVPSLKKGDTIANVGVVKK